MSSLLHYTYISCTHRLQAHTYLIQYMVYYTVCIVYSMYCVQYVLCTVCIVYSMLCTVYVSTQSVSVCHTYSIWKWQIDIMKYQFAYIEQCRQQTVNFRITPQQRNEVCFPYTPLHSIDVVYDKQATSSFILHTPVSSSTDECVHKMADGELVCTLMRQSSQTRACSCEKDVRRPGC